LQRGKNPSFDGSDEEWLNILLGAIFSRDNKGEKSVTLSAQVKEARRAVV